MKFWSTILIIASLTAVAVFGFMGINRCEDGSGCLLSFASGLFCPAGANKLALSIFHANAFHHFSIAILKSAAVFLAMALASLLLLAGLKFFRPQRQQEQTNHIQSFVFRSQTICSFVLERFLSWLQLRQRRYPAF